MTPTEVLQKYWGFTQFRPVQGEIIQSVLEGHDTLAILPTGGGKSVCFQVPAIIKEGTALVVTPLVSLMKDQVQLLKKMQIPAATLHSGIPSHEQEWILDNLVNKAYKFLYLSPERLLSGKFKDRLAYVALNLLVVDEAHCISQWGYDFRPPYLQIAHIRENFPKVPCVALTASATPMVQKDICEKLKLTNPKIFRKSFSRPALSYSVFCEPDKLRKLKDILHKVKGSAIVYVRNRKLTKETAMYLVQSGFSASNYHAGLPHSEREQKQTAWIENKFRVMVATNAFGMGINKPDVRTVIHLDVPESLEAYYQEAGRAGRDEKKAYAVLLYQEHDLAAIKNNIAEKYPEWNFLEELYHKLYNHCNIATGEFTPEGFDFDLDAFASKHAWNPRKVFYGLKQLENQKIIVFNESFYSPSKLHIPDYTSLYQFQVANSNYDPFIKALLRIYGADLYADFVEISEKKISQKMQLHVHQVITILHKLASLGIWIYTPQKDSPQVFFLMPRVASFAQAFSYKEYQFRKDNDEEKAQKMSDFVTQLYMCRATFIAHYFGEYTAIDCGVCDFCIAERKKNEEIRIDPIFERQLLVAIETKNPLPHELFHLFPHVKQSTIIRAIKAALEQKRIGYTLQGRLEKK